MGACTANRIDCPAGTWTRVIACGFGQGPREFDVTFESSDQAPIAGEFRELKSVWILASSPSSGPLQPALRFHRGYFNTFYAVEVRPAADLVALVR